MPTITVEVQVGSVVYLKSGSCRMTVTGIDGDMVEVVYSVYGTSEIKCKKLPLAVLHVVQ